MSFLTDQQRAELRARHIPANSGRTRLNLTGAIDLLSHRVHIREDKTLNAIATIAFIQQLEEAYPTMEKVHVFCDNASYYRNKEVTKHLNNSKIRSAKNIFEYHRYIIGHCRMHDGSKIFTQLCCNMSYPAKASMNEQGLPGGYL